MAACVHTGPWRAALAALLLTAASVLAEEACEAEVKPSASISVLQVRANTTSAGSLGCPSTAPPVGQACVVIVAFQENQTAEWIERFVGDCCPVARKKVLKGVKAGVFRFPPSEREVCCYTARRVQKAAGVMSVEFDGTVYADEDGKLKGSGDVTGETVKPSHPPSRGGARSSMSQGLPFAALLIAGALCGGWPLSA
uniref:Uncharacterized protein n=1 Tax=Alexandrium catenella TaxID=2925 RepID=A0A7S1RJ24_ALECA|mmetsp:Transcript_60644/g.162314  ORF Transcript_60644/g.162314 Transcript_60644/m.162314 type:complete len:197 (+) Transcript_60644:68-658(+)